MTWTGEYFTTTTTITGIVTKVGHTTWHTTSQDTISFHQHLYRVCTGGVFCAFCGDELKTLGGPNG